MESNGGNGDGLHLLRSRRPLVERLFDSCLDDINQVIGAVRTGSLTQARAVRELEALVDIARHLATDGTIQKGLEHAEMALLNAVFHAVDEPGCSSAEDVSPG